MRRGALIEGVPTTVKDAVLARGWPTLRGSKTIAPEGPWGEDAPAVARLREHGAVLIGQTCAPEFSWQGVTDSPLRGTTRNPWNTDLTPGGSSAGAGAAAAAGMGVLHLGGDGGGSVRIPAALCSTYGLKPDSMRIPFHPQSAPGKPGALGPLTRAVTDAALMLTVMAEPDARDWWAMPYQARDDRIGIDAGIAGVRIAYSPAFGGVAVDAQVARLVARAVGVLADLGAHVEEADPGFDDPAEAWHDPLAALLAAQLGALPGAQQELLDPGLARVIAYGRTVQVGQLVQAESVRAALGQRMSRLHQPFDLLVSPQLPWTAFAVGVDFAAPPTTAGGSPGARSPTPST